MSTPTDLEEIFLAALKRNTPADRAVFLEQTCRHDAETRREVERLVAAHARIGDFLEKLPPEVSAAAQQLAAQDSSRPDLDFLSPPTRPGALGRLAHYEILEVLGSGGFGVVLRAFDDKLQRVVAVKMLSRSLAASATARQRFVREARAAAAVNHESVVHIYAVEEAGPVPYLVMEHIAGISLDDKLRQSGPLPIGEVLRFGRQIAEGLAAAHRLGLVHRDIKPANILLEENSARVKITDFGLARAVDDTSLSREGIVAGTPEYMSPEQARGQPVDHRSDLFSLGSVLYAMCTGRPPFTADGSLAVLARVTNDTPLAIKAINPRIPPWLNDLIIRLHTKSPDARFSSAEEVANQLHAERIEVVRRSFRAGRRVPAAIVLMVIALVGFSLLSVARWGGNQGRLKHDANEGTSTPSVVRPAPVFIPQHHSFQIDHQVVALAVSADGRKLAIGTAARLGESGPERTGTFPIVLWDLESKTEKRRLAGHQSAVRGLAFSADGTRLFSASSDRHLRAWNVETGEELWNIRLSPNDVFGIAFSSDGRRLLAGCGNRVVRLLDVETTNEVWQYSQMAENVSTVALSRDGRIGLATGQQSWDNDLRKWIPGADQSLRVWDFSTGQQRQQLSGHTAFVMSAAISSDGSRAVSGGHDKTLRVWNLETGDQILSFTVPGVVVSVALSPDGRRALSGGGDTVVHFWDLENQREINTFHRHRVGVSCVAFSADESTAFSGDMDGMICTWQLSN